MRRLTFLFVFITAILSVHQVAGQHKVSSLSGDTVQATYPHMQRASRLIKAGIGLPIYRASSVSPVFFDVAADVTMEQKIHKNISVVGGLESHYLFSRYAQLYSLELPIGLRYYFSIGKKMKKRAELNSFFRHYIALQTYNVLFADLTYELPNPSVQRYYRGQQLDHFTNGGKYQEGFNMLQLAYLQIGTQLKMSKTNYLDMNVVIPISPLVYTKNELTLAVPAYVTIKYGISWQR